jgi:NitT/TauT family transport system permease protein
MSNASRRREKFFSAFRSLLGLALLTGAYEALSLSGMFPRVLLPTVEKIWTTLFGMLLDGSMFAHAEATLERVLAGFLMAAVIGVPIGIAMGRSRRVERFVMPLTTALMPIPSLAWLPVLILWFGLGNLVAVLIVFYAALFPILLNTWSGVRSVNPIWLRAAGAMGAGERTMFWRVIMPGASPFIIIGLRQAFLRSWIAVVGAEMISASDWGLGWVIFDAKEFLNADVMIATLLVIGAIGLAFERLIFNAIERVTVQRWGMVKVIKS